MARLTNRLSSIFLAIVLVIGLMPSLAFATEENTSSNIDNNESESTKALATESHTWSSDWSFDGSCHWHECLDDCTDLTKNSDKDGYGAHSGGTASCQTLAACEVCNATYGEVDASNHTGGTEVRDAKEATATESGYTGDTYCLGCNTKITDGEIIAPTTELTYAISNGEVTITGYEGTDTELVIPSVIDGNAVVAIGSEAFKACTNLQKVELPEGIKEISDYAFAHCYSLEKINIPEGVTSIGAGAFWWCSSLKNIDIPASVISVGENAFVGITDPSTITVSTKTQFDELSGNDTRISTNRTTVKQLLIGATISGVSSSYVYTGAGIKPTPTVVIDDMTLVNGTDYSIEYINNTTVGTAEMVITGKGNYTGTITKTFIITKPLTGWQKKSGQWYYYNSKGIMQTGWVKPKTKWYYLDSNGVMQTGWKKISGKWYYLNSSGVMQTGWQKISGKWYYMNSSGAMQVGWLKAGGKWYYLNSSGAMLTGWQKISGKYYYFNSSGVMQKSKWIGNYYVLSSGKMATSQWIGKYWVNASGKWTKTRK